MAKKKKEYLLPTEEEIDKFEMLSGFLNSISYEMEEFSKKKPDGALNKLKVKMINRILEQVKDILSSEPTAEFLDLLDDETLPSNSDAVLIIGQFKSAIDQFNNKYKYSDSTGSDSIGSDSIVFDGIGSVGRWHTQERP